MTTRLIPRGAKIVLIALAGLVVASVLYHNHPDMNALQEQLRTRAPAMFKLFLAGEAVYFAGMILMATGLGTSLGPNPLTWKSKVQQMLSAEGPGLTRAKLFWVGFACNVLGSLTFGVIGLYVAAEILPGGAATLVPAAFVDMAFALLVRYAIYRRFAGKKNGSG